MTRATIELLIRLIGKLKKNQPLLPTADSRDGLVKVNLGCGLRVVSGWLNIDASINTLIAGCPLYLQKLAYSLSGSRMYYSVDEYCRLLNSNKFAYRDLSLSLPLPESCIDVIYSSHFLEHLFKDDAEKLLRGCMRSLKPGGLIRIVVPDLAYAISLYNINKKREMLDEFFFVENKGSYLARHKYMYDFEILQELLENSGFSYIRRCEFQQGLTPDINVLDSYPGISLFVEATKNPI